MKMKAAIILRLWMTLKVQNQFQICDFLLIKTLLMRISLYLIAHQRLHEIKDGKKGTKSLF